MGETTPASLFSYPPSGEAWATEYCSRKVGELERTYKGAPIEDIWEIWTAKAGIESGWGPDEFFVKVHLLELRVGGALEYEMRTKNEDTIAYLKTAGVSPTTQVRASTVRSLRRSAPPTSRAPSS